MQTAEGAEIDRRRPLRVGVDGSCWSNRRGFGRFTRGLVPELVLRGRHHYVIVIDEPSRAEALLPVGAEVVTVPVDQAPAEAASAAGRRSLRDIVRMSWAATRAGCDAFYFPTTYTYYPVLGCPSLVTVHDATAERLPDLVLATRRARLAWNLKQRAALATGPVITVSRAGRTEIVEWLGVSDHRLHVVREAPDSRFRPIPAPVRDRALQQLSPAPGDRYLLYVGGISPHKNLEVLVKAFELVADVYPDVQLMIVGDTSEDPFLSSARSLKGSVDSSPVRHRISLPGYVDDELLVALYGGALATVLPSLGEGFGLTAAESAACGTPVVASDIPALRELLSSAALYAPAHDPVAFAAAFRQLLDDPPLRARLADASLERSTTWSWGEAADTVSRLLSEIASRVVSPSVKARYRV